MTVQCNFAKAHISKRANMFVLGVANVHSTIISLQAQTSAQSVVDRVTKSVGDAVKIEIVRTENEEDTAILRTSNVVNISIINHNSTTSTCSNAIMKQQEQAIRQRTCRQAIAATITERSSSSACSSVGEFEIILSCDELRFFVQDSWMHRNARQCKKRR